MSMSAHAAASPSAYPHQSARNAVGTQIDFPAMCTAGVGAVDGAGGRGHGAGSLPALRPNIPRSRNPP